MYKELIERLEKAEGWDRQLDHDIALATGWTQSFSGATGTTPAGMRSPDGQYHYNAHLFTGSVDAARSLLPWGEHPGATFTSKTIQSGYDEFYHFTEFTWPSTERQGRARTEAVATCICALLAIEETERQIAPYRTPKDRAMTAPAE